LRQAKLKNKLFAKAFSWVRAGGSLNSGVLYGEARAGAKALALVSQPFTGETLKESLFCFSSFKSRIHDLAEIGDRKGLRKALLEYLRLWGVLC
jgi:hypothetical protein